MCESYLALAGSSLWSRDARIVLYLLALLYCFLGVAIVADVFMNAIEVITSKEKTRMVKGPNGKTCDEVCGAQGLQCNSAKMDEIIQKIKS